MNTLDARLREAAGKLAAHGVEDPLREARLIWESVSGLTPAAQLASPQQAVDPVQGEAFDAAVERRSARVPFAYLDGRQDFYGYEFAVEHCLIPRPETELAVDWILDHAAEWLGDECRILDLCTGSGCLGLTLALELGRSRRVSLVATDLSAEALQTAGKNAQRLGVERAELIQADLFPPQTDVFDLITANPPYVTPDEYALLEPEVRLYEPQMALLGGADGLDFYRRILSGLQPYLRRTAEAGRDRPEGACGTVLLLEHGRGQRQAVAAMARAQLGPVQEEFLLDDWQGIDRFYVCRL